MTTVSQTLIPTRTLTNLYHFKVVRAGETRHTASETVSTESNSCIAAMATLSESGLFPVEECLLWPVGEERLTKTHTIENEFFTDLVRGAVLGA